MMLKSFLALLLFLSATANQPKGFDQSLVKNKLPKLPTGTVQTAQKTPENPKSAKTITFNQIPNKSGLVTAAKQPPTGSGSNLSGIG